MSDAERLEKLLLMLSSDHDGEIVNAARAIGRALREGGADWHDLVNRLKNNSKNNPNQKPRDEHPPGDWRIMREFCLDRDRLLRPREREFVVRLGDRRIDREATRLAARDLSAPGRNKQMSFAASAAKCARRASSAANPHLHTQLHTYEANMVDNFTDDFDTPTEKDLDELYGSKYLGTTDVGDKKIRTRIAKIRKEALQQQGGKERTKFVVYFTTIDKPMVLNATNKNRLVEKLGRNPAGWVNAELGLYTEPTQFAGKPTMGLRLKVLSAPKAAAAPAPIAKPAPKPDFGDAPAYSEDPGFGLDNEADFNEAAE